MRRRGGRCSMAAIGGAFGLGVLLVLTCSFRLALVMAAALLVALCWAIFKY